MKMSKKITNFAKQVLAQLAGDTDGVIAAQNERKCLSALESQIAVLNGKVVDQEETVKDREEALNKAKFPSVKVVDRDAYLRGIKEAQARLDDAQSTLNDTNESIAYWKGCIAEFSETVEVEETQA